MENPFSEPSAISSTGLFIMSLAFLLFYFVESNMFKKKKPANQNYS
jgi:hypothetical protein